MDIKTHLEEGTGFTWKELRYLKMPPLPYFIYVDDTYIRGADILNNIIEHNLVLEYYNDTEDKTKEKIIEDFLNENDYRYTKNKEWLENEKMFVIVYEIDTFLEKIERSNINA